MLTTLLSGKTLQKIPYSDKPLLLGGQITYLTPEEFEKKFKCHYTESLLADPTQLGDSLNDKILAVIKVISDINKINSQEVIDRLNNPLDCLVICEMGSNVGCGVFTSKPLPAGTILGIYAGEVVDINTESAYKLEWIPPEALSEDSEAIKEFIKGLSIPARCINARTHRGTVGFFQHLPTDLKRNRQFLQQQGISQVVYEESDELAEATKLLSISEADIARENVELLPTSISIPGSGKAIVRVARTLCDITPGQQVGYSYGRSYWCEKTTPCYFREEGTVLRLPQQPNITRLSKLRATFFIKDMAELSEKYGRGVDAFKSGNYSTAIHLITPLLMHLELIDKPTEEDIRAKALCQSTLASCYREQGNFKEAQKYAKRALFHRLSVSPKTDPLVISALKKLKDIREKIRSSASSAAQLKS